MSPDGRRVIFLRSSNGSDPVNALWVFDTATGEERLVADPRELLAETTDEDGDLPPEERARRERAREGAGGITAYATDAAATVVCFALAGRLFAGGLLSGQARALEVAGPVFDPRPDPLARRLAYVSGATLRIGELDGSSRVLVGAGEPDTVSWGSADFIAAEEMGRFRGYWWSPDGTTLAACRVDNAAVSEWVIADPAHPERPATTVRYPAAGTANADVTLHLVRLDGSRTAVDWDREFFPYLAAVDWSDSGLILHVQSRDQQGSMVLRVDTSDGATRGETSVLSHDYDDAWVELVPGVPALLGDGRLVTTADRDGARRLLVDGEPVTPTDLQVRSVSAATGDTVVFSANPIDDATVLHVFRWDGTEVVALVDSPGVHSVVVGGATTVLRSATLDQAGSTTTVRTDRGPDDTQEFVIDSLAEWPLVSPNVEILHVGERRLATAVLLPHDHDGSPLPVLLDPYGGPHALRVPAVHQRVPDLPVVRRSGLRGHHHRRSRHARARQRVGAGRARRPRHRRARRPGRRPPGRCRPDRRTRPGPRGDPRLELRRLPRGAGRAPAPRRVPRRHRRGAGDGMAAVRHALHRAVPR